MGGEWSKSGTKEQRNRWKPTQHGRVGQHGPTVLCAVEGFLQQKRTRSSWATRPDRVLLWEDFCDVLLWVLFDGFDDLYAYLRCFYAFLWS